MCHRRLTGSVLLGTCLLFGAGRLFGQRVDTLPASARREVIATTVPITSDTPPTPLPLPNAPPAAAPTTGGIQQVSFVPEPPAPSTSPSPADATAGASMLPPNALFREMKASPPTDSRPTNPPAATAAAVSVEVVGPDRLLLGKPLAYEIVLRNTGGRPVAELHVEEPLPAGARALKSDPPATTKDNRLTWDLRNLEVGGERRLKVELQPGRHGELDLRPYVTFLCGDGLRTKVTRPPFSVEISADRDKAPRGGRIRFTIILANHGDAPISNIYLYDQLPPGLHHPDGPKIGSTERFNLQPEETRTITLETTGVESGTFRNEVSAVADHGIEARTALDVVITEPSLSLRLDGPTQTVTQREEDFHLEASNSGTLPAKNVLLVQALPPTVDVISASSGACLDSKQHALVWSLSDLTAGQRQTVTFRVKASLAGDWPLIAAVQSQNLPETRVNHMLHAEAAAALKLEVRAREERLAIGAETIFSMHVFNKGDAPCSGLRLTAQLPEALTPLNAQGPTAGKVEKQQVSFAPLAQLDAHGDVVYRIHVRGRQAGKGSLRVELTADKQPPAQREISIQVYGEEHAAAQNGNVGNCQVGPP